jgi:hypothetical protein
MRKFLIFSQAILSQKRAQARADKTPPTDVKECALFLSQLTTADRIDSPF